MIIRHVVDTTATSIPPLVVDITTDTCPCGATYVTRDGDPDPTVYGAWLDNHNDHFAGAID